MEDKGLHVILCWLQTIFYITIFLKIFNGGDCIVLIIFDGFVVFYISNLLLSLSRDMLLTNSVEVFSLEFSVRVTRHSFVYVQS